MFEDIADDAELLAVEAPDAEVVAVEAPDTEVEIELEVELGVTVVREDNPESVV